jgi:SSS family solute:Na+ symporter
MSAKDDRMLTRSLIIGSIFMIVIVGAAYTVGPISNVYFFEHYGETAAGVALGTDYIIPAFILDIFGTMTFGDIFVSLFLLALICAAISTISALMHTIGAAGGHDLYTLIRNRKTKSNEDAQSLNVNRSVTGIVMVLVVVYCYLMPSDIIAKATSLFMGMTAAALLPAFAHGLYSKFPRKDAALASIITGTASYLIWTLFINASSSVFLPICKWITGDTVLFMTSNIRFVDALIVSLPISVITIILVLYLRKPSRTTGPELEPEIEN